MKSTATKYNLDSFDSGHFFEDLSAHDSFYFKKSFRGKKYKFDIWNGCLIPTSREHHAELLELIKGTIVHPMIEKWLYLPQSSEHFEDLPSRPIIHGELSSHCRVQ